MRKFINGSGSDSTAAVNAFLASHRQLYLADLYVINTAPCYDGQTMGKQFLLTDYPSPLKWDYKGTFLTAVISRQGVESKIGLDSNAVEVTWSPKDTDILATSGGVTLLTAMQGFQCGVFDNGNVEIWRCVMPTPGDCNTYGACLIWSGRIGDIKPDRLNVVMPVVPRTETLNVQVPTNLIEPTNIMAQYSVGLTPKNGPAVFEVQPGSTRSLIYADPVSPPVEYIPASGIYDWGFIRMADGTLLGGTHRSIRQQTYGAIAGTLSSSVQVGPIVSPIPGGQSNTGGDWEYDNHNEWRTTGSATSSAGTLSPLIVTVDLSSLPSGTIPTGISFQFSATSQDTSGDYLNSLQILDAGGSPTGVAKSNTNPFPSGAWQTYTYGDQSDTWGIDPDTLVAIVASGSIKFSITVYQNQIRCFLSGFKPTIWASYQVLWTSTTAYTVGNSFVDSNGNMQRVTTAGTSGGTEPTWSTTSGATTSDGSVVWTNLGAAHHAFYLYEDLPFDPTVGDQFQAYIEVPRDRNGASENNLVFAAFPYVPSAVNSSVVIT